MNFDSFVEWLKGENRIDLLENLSYVILVTAAVFSVIGISVGTFVSGFPVLLAVLGAFLALAGIVLYILSEFIRILE